MEIGIFSFGDCTEEVGTGNKISPQERLRRLLEEIKLADEVGLDVFGIGEHHRQDFIIPSPAIVLAAAASITKKIRLSSAVVVLSSDDPVRVFQQFTLIDLISNGRAEIMVGRGSFIESFPLFGYNLDDYEELFEEKLNLLLQIREQEVVSWKGKFRAPLNNQRIVPRPVQEKLPIWIAAGGSPQSAARAGKLGLPLAIAIIGGIPERFSNFVDLFRREALSAHNQVPPLSINSHGFIADTDKEAYNIAFPAIKKTMDQLGRERGWPPMSKEQFDFSVSLQGANFVGSPERIIEKILYQHQIFKHQRFLLQLTISTIPHKDVLKAIELMGTKVAPAVRKELGHH
ncbi:MAG: LLM class flavin-dependent oxidoreductase [Bacteroidales bacterium]|nr:LLM class flavin-dependent oxidoreductase [Bacteroidales bacterium]